MNTAGQQNALPMKLYSTGPGTWRCEYVPQAVGPLNVNIFFENQVIPFSPFGVRVQPGNLIAPAVCSRRTSAVVNLTATRSDGLAFRWLRAVNFYWL